MIKKKKILVIDNDKDILTSIKNVLEEKFFVKTANESEDGIFEARFTEFDLVLIDLHMGSNLSGYDILKRLKKEAKGKPKLVYISVIPKKEINLTGTDGFIQKPFNIKSFLIEVYELLKR
jgi:two-component system, OmpR family, response regulator CiaR